MSSYLELQVIDETKPKDKGNFFSRLFRANSKQNIVKSTKNKNNNNNQQFLSNESEIIQSSSNSSSSSSDGQTTAIEADYEDNANRIVYLKKAKSSPELNRSNNRKEDYDDDYLNYQLDDLFANNYADARVTINPLLKKNLISITFFSIINNTNVILKHVHIVIDIYYEDSWQKRLISKLNKITMWPNEEKPFDHNFLIECKQLQLNRIKLNIFIVGKRSKNDNDESIKTINEKDNLIEIRILGGAHIIMDRLLII